MWATLSIEIGPCWPGISFGLFPEIRLGVLRLWWCRGSLYERVAGWRRALDEARTEVLRLLSKPCAEPTRDAVRKVPRA